MAAAALRQAFLQADQEGARQVWRRLADQLRPRWPKLAGLMDESEHDVLAYMAFPLQHRPELHSPNPPERPDKEVKRRADVVGLFPGEPSITRLIDRRRAAGGERRVAAAAAPLQAGRGDGRAALARPRGRHPETSTPGRLIDGHLGARSIFHHVDKRDRPARGRRLGWGRSEEHTSE